MKLTYPELSDMPLDRVTAMMFCIAIAKDLKKNEWYWSIENGIPTIHLKNNLQ